MKKLYRICNPENPIEREETLLIFRTEARFELSLTTRAKSLKPAYEKFLRAFNKACADGAIDADLARQILEEIISEADVSTLDAVLKESLRIRDNSARA